MSAPHLRACPRRRRLAAPRWPASLPVHDQDAKRGSRWLAARGENRANANLVRLDPRDALTGLPPGMKTSPRLMVEVSSSAPQYTCDRVSCTHLAAEPSRGARASPARSAARGQGRTGFANAPGVRFPATRPFACPGRRATVRRATHQTGTPRDRWTPSCPDRHARRQRRRRPAASEPTRARGKPRP